MSPDHFSRMDQFPQDDDYGDPRRVDDRFQEPPAEMQDARAEAKLRRDINAGLEQVIVSLSDACVSLSRLPHLDDIDDGEVKELRAELNEWIARLEKVEGSR